MTIPTYCMNYTVNSTNKRETKKDLRNKRINKEELNIQSEMKHITRLTPECRQNYFYSIPIGTC